MLIKNLIQWSVNNRLVVILLAAVLMGFGIYSFFQVNVEAYPDPAPAIIEVVARYPGASGEEVERQVTIPLEVALAGMPGLKYTRTQSMFELCHIRNQFEYGVDPAQARQEVLNRLRLANLPAGVTPDISPQSPTGEIYRYVLTNPKDSAGRGIYDLNDLKSLQDWTLERLFRRLPLIADVTSFGGTVKRYEIHPDPSRMQRYGITLQQIKDAISSSNSNAGGEYLVGGDAAHVVRSLGLIGEGQDPIETAMGMKDPLAARDYLRAEESRRITDVRQIVLTATNNVPVRIDDVVEGGPLRPGQPVSQKGVIVGYQTRLGHVMYSFPARDSHGREILDSQGRRKWHDDDDVVQCVVLLRKGEQSLPALEQVRTLVKQLNEMPGRLLPGVKIQPYYDRTDLIHVTTDTVRENLLTGMGLVVVVLLMFLTNVRSALIVALNVPLALLFAFSVLFLRGKSANLLSIGAVDFGIIVDSSVIMVENIYRHLAAGENADLPLKTRIIRAAGEIDRALLFSTLIMMCAFIPLFTMQGPEGALFGPMAQTYAFALAGALVLAVMLAPVLCLLLFKNLKPVPDNLLVRLIKYSYLRQLDRCLRHRWLTVLFFGALIAGTACLVPSLGREFMPELEEGNLWVQAQFPLNSSLEEVCALAAKAHEIFKQCPEGECVLSQVGRPDDGTDPAGFYNAEFFLPLKPRSQWPILPGMSRPRTKEELTAAVTKELESSIIAAEWNFSQNIRNMVIESLSGVRGENCVKIIGPDLAGLEQLANRVVKVLKGIKGLDEVGVYRVMGQSNLTLPVDRQKCARWNLKVGDVQAVVDTAVGGKPFSQMIEGERSFDITLRYAKERRANLDAILKIPVEVGGNTVASSQSPGQSATPVSGANIGPSPTGTAADLPSLTGSGMNATFNDLGRTPHRRLGDLVIPHTADGRPDPHGSFMQQGASDIYRDQGERLIAVKFDIHGRDLAGAVEEARQKTKHLFQAPYRGVWTGEFEEMQDAETRLLKIVPMSLGLIFILLYLALRSWLDAVVVISNVFALAIGGVWALYLTGTNFNISAAVGFISLFGVAIMDGLLMISYFNTLRAQGEPLDRAIIEGAGKRVRPVMMTALTALFGLLPAALSTQIGSQTQRPLAIVVVGGMMTTILLTRYLMPVLYSFYGHREPPAEAAAGVVH